MNKFTYANNGLKAIQGRFLNTKRDVEFDLPLRLIELFKKIRQEIPIDSAVTCRFNIAALIRWVIDILGDYNRDVFQMPPSSFNVMLLLMGMMELNQLLRGLSSAKEINQVPELTMRLQKNAEEVRIRCQSYATKINSSECGVISENTRKSRDILLLKRGEILKRDSDFILSPLIQLDLNCAFSNIMLNLRRMIRQAWLRRQGEISYYFRGLKILEVVLYYLSASTFTPVEETVRLMAFDILHPERQLTYVHLIHEEDGLHKLSNYLQEVPLLGMQADMDFISNLINRHSKQ